jgi:hypothetical protein
MATKKFRSKPITGSEDEDDGDNETPIQSIKQSVMKKQKKKKVVKTGLSFENGDEEVQAIVCQNFA